MYARVLHPTRLLALPALLLAVACPSPQPEAPGGRVLVVGIDGASPRIVEPLLAAGRLPNLARIAREGASGPLRSLLPLRSPRIWTTVATGRLPGQHGILNFFYTRDRVRHLYDSTQRQVPAIWSIASHRGRSVGVVNWWTTFPPEKVEGVMVSDHFLAAHMAGIRDLFHVATEQTGPVTWPEDWADGLDGRLARVPRLAPQSDPFGDRERLPHWTRRIPKEGDVDFFARVTRDDAQLARLALLIDAERRPDLLMVLLIGIDRASHILWSTVEPGETYEEDLRPTPEAREVGVSALHAYYEYSDQLIGALASGYGEGDTIVVLSDHGFEADASSDTVTGGHKGRPAIEGVLFARGPGISAGSTTRGTRVTDVAPLLLHQLGLPLSVDLDGVLPAFVETPPGATLETWNDVPVEFLEFESSPVEAERIERLRALGYGE